MNMKMTVAIVRPHALEKIIVALEAIENFPGITITEVEGFGELARLSKFSEMNPFHLQKQIKIIASDEITGEIVAAIRQQGHTGKKGDGIIAVLPVEKVFNI